MSVKVHEPVCMDSRQDLYFWFDHFLGDQLKDEWDTTIVGGGAVAVIDQQTGGIVRLTTGALDGNDTGIDWNDIRSLLVSKKATFESRLKINNTASMNCIFGLSFDTLNQVTFVEVNTVWFIRCRDGGAITQVTTGIALDTDYHVFRIEAFPTGEVHFYIDGVETGNSPITTNIPPAYLQSAFWIETAEDVAKSLDIDYVVVRQDR